MWGLSQTDQFFKTVETESICEVYEEEYFYNSTVKTLALFQPFEKQIKFSEVMVIPRLCFSQPLEKI